MDCDSGRPARAHIVPRDGALTRAQGLREALSVAARVIF
jgi:hypothetical protein